MHPLNPTNIVKASTSVEHVVQSAETRKIFLNKAKCLELGWQCLPLAVSVYGGWGEIACRTFKRISGRLALQTLVTQDGADNGMYGRLSATLMQSNARALLFRSGDSIGGAQILTSGPPLT